MFGTEQVTKETWEPSSLSASSLHSDFLKVINISKKQQLFTKRKTPASTQQSQAIKLSSRDRINLLQVKPKQRVIQSMKE